MLVFIAAPTFSLDLQPSDERTALEQRLDQYRGIVLSALSGVPWDKASTRLLPSTDMTIAGIVQHLAWVAHLWFQGRFVGGQMPAPWDRPGAAGADWSRRLVPGDAVALTAVANIAVVDPSPRTPAASPRLNQIG